jgi:pimeloyl-ACP methyl ester carboxylesterase
VSFYSCSSIRRSLSLLSLISALTLAVSARPITASDPLPTAPVIVIGFVGGFVRHDDMVHSAVQVAAHLRQDYPSGVYVEVLENHQREKAHADIVRWVDTNRDGTLSIDEKQNARIILYGHSWGASEAITLARELGREGIPVLLTIQVDSVPKPGENDKVIPPNVAEAANFYQLNGFLHGEPQIRAADPAHTRILGNFRFDYKANPIDCKQYPWYDRIFMKFHTEIECDPKVWTQVESMIHSRLSLWR